MGIGRSKFLLTANQSVLPRVHVGAMPYALEADSATIAATAKNVNCVGCVKVDAMTFDKDVDHQGFAVIAGKLSTGAAGANLTTGVLDLGPGLGDEFTSAHVKTLTGGGNADALHTHAGGGGGGQVIKFKGVTSVKMNGLQGVPAMDLQCGKDFAAARMCKTHVLEDIYPRPLPAAQAWVLITNAIYNESVPTVDGAPHVANANSCSGNPNNFNTAFSADALGNSGLTWSDKGVYGSANCQTQLPIACCGP